MRNQRQKAVLSRMRRGSYLCTWLMAFLPVLGVEKFSMLLTPLPHEALPDRISALDVSSLWARYMVDIRYSSASGLCNLTLREDPKDWQDWPERDRKLMQGLALLSPEIRKALDPQIRDFLPNVSGARNTPDTLHYWFEKRVLEVRPWRLALLGLDEKMGKVAREAGFRWVTTVLKEPSK